MDIGPFEVTTGRQTTCKSCDSCTERGDFALQVGRRRFAFEIRVGGDDDFGDFFGANPGQQIVEVDVLTPHSLERCNPTVEHVVASFKNSRALDGKRIKGLFDHTNHRRLSIRVAADRTELLVANVVATLAVPHLCFEGH